VATRITVHYSKKIEEEYPMLVQAINDLPDRAILFLQTLQNIHINITGRDAHHDEINITKTYDQLKTSCTITRSFDCHGIPGKSTNVFLLFRITKVDMLAHLRKHTRGTDIDLASPINSTTKQPGLCEFGRYVCAFLPVQQLREIQVSI
jgi:hypothetical protein